MFYTQEFHNIYSWAYARNEDFEPTPNYECQVFAYMKQNNETFCTCFKCGGEGDCSRETVQAI
jgi:hypothetical protein